MKLAPQRFKTSSKSSLERLSRAPEWSALREPDLEVLRKRIVSRSYAKGECIFTEGDPCDGVHFMVEGIVAISKSGLNGYATLLRVARAGDTIGYRSLLADDDHTTRAEAMAETVTFYIDSSIVRQLIVDNVALGLSFLTRAATDLGAAEERFHVTVAETVKARVVHLLNDLQSQVGFGAGEEGASMEISLTQEKVAAMVGARRESVSRVIHELSEEGLVQRIGRHIKIPYA